MRASEGRLGRVFVIRLEDGDEIPGCIEEFAAGRGVSAGHAILVGGIGGGRIVAGPRRSDAMPPDPVVLPVEGVHEVLGVGVLAPGGDGRPRLHMHAALGREGRTLAGCLRPGVRTWLVGEVVLYEILDSGAARVPDERSGLELLEPGPGG